MTRRDLTIGIALLALFALLPLFVTERYPITQITLFFIWATVVSQWNLVFGVAGIFSLAQLAVFAIGAYFAAAFGVYAGWPLWATAPVAVAVAVLFSAAIGFACFRLTGAYVALVTFAIALAIQVLILTDVDCFRQDGTVCMQLTGGVKGFSRFGDLGFRQLLGNAAWHLGNYYVSLLLLSLAMAFALMVISSPLGLAFRAVRDNPAYAAARGVNRFGAQLLVFALSAIFTALAGVVYAGHFRVVGPSIMEMSLTTFLVAMMVVGGVGRPWGPLVGAAVLMAADELLKEVTDYRNIGLGLVMIVCVVLMPGGITGALDRLAGLRKTAKSTADASSA